MRLMCSILFFCSLTLHMHAMTSLTKTVSSILAWISSAAPAPKKTKSPIIKLSDKVKLVIFVPKTHVEIVYQVLGKEGAGSIGIFTYCSFSVEGIGRWLEPESKEQNNNDTKLEHAIEYRVETVCSKTDVCALLSAVRKVHPYREMGYDIYPLLEVVQ